MQFRNGKKYLKINQGDKNKNNLLLYLKEQKSRYIHKFEWLWKKQLAKRKNNSIKKKKRNQNLRNKKDKKRYAKRKSYHIKTTLTENLKSSILNKSGQEMNENDYCLLNQGLNFVPTPKWSPALERK